MTTVVEPERPPRRGPGKRLVLVVIGVILAIALIILGATSIGGNGNVPLNNPANPEIHSATTAQELWQDTDGQMAAFIAGVGTGGTLTGVGRVWKRRRPAGVLPPTAVPKRSPRG